MSVSLIQRNIIANIIGRVWGVASVFVFVPYYIKYLGVEAYGLVGFYAALMGVLAFADMGFTATLSRELARLSGCGTAFKEMNVILRTYEAVYGVVSLIIALLIYVLAPLIARRWLNSNILPAHEVVSAIRMMGVAVVIQMLAGLYIGGLMGRQCQVTANWLQIAWGGLRGLGSICVLWMIAPTINAFMMWQIISNVIYCFCARYSLRLHLSSDKCPGRFDFNVFKHTWQYAAGMFCMAVISTVLMQADKVVVSKMLPLEMLGYYSIAGALATAPLMLAAPIACAVFPRLTSLVAINDTPCIITMYHKACQLLSLVVLPVGITLVAFSGEFIFAWTGSMDIARHAGPAAKFLLLGQMMQALTMIPYYLALSHGDIKIVVIVGIASVVFITPLLCFLVAKFGLLGAGISWFVMNILSMPPYMYFLHKRFLPAEGWRWLVRDVAVPFLVVLSCVLLARCFLPAYESRVGVVCVLIAIIVITAAVLAIFISLVRDFLRKTVGGICAK